MKKKIKKVALNVRKSMKMRNDVNVILSYEKNVGEREGCNTKRL